MEHLTIHWQGPQTAPTIVLLHGFMGVPSDWAPVCEALGEWQIGLVELHPMDPVSFLNALSEAIRAHGLSRVAIGGYSMGGRLAIYCAMQNPALFPVLIGVSTTPGIEDAVQRETRAAADLEMANRLRALKTQEEFEGFLREWWHQGIFVSPRMHSGLLDQLVESRLDLAPATLADFHALWSSGTLPSQWEAIKNYPGSALLLIGSQDTKYSDIAKRMEQGLTDATTEILAGCGHQLLWEAPQEMGWAMHHFLEKHAPGKL